MLHGLGAVGSDDVGFVANLVVVDVDETVLCVVLVVLRVVIVECFDVDVCVVVGTVVVGVVVVNKLQVND